MITHINREKVNETVTIGDLIIRQAGGRYYLSALGRWVELTPGPETWYITPIEGVSIQEASRAALRFPNVYAMLDWYYMNPDHQHDNFLPYSRTSTVQVAVVDETVGDEVTRFAAYDETEE